MKVLGIKSFLCISIALVSTSLFGQVIFQPSLTTCKRPWSNGSFRFCTGAAVAVPFNAVTSTASPYLTQLPIENTLGYRLYCPAFPDSTSVGLTAGSTRQTLLASSSAAAERIQQTASLTMLPSASYVFSPTINYNATYEGSCKMEVTSNVSIPNVDMLRTVVDLLKNNYTDLGDLKASIDEAAELPAKWVIIKDSPSTVEDLANNLAFEISGLQQELDTLKGTDPSALSANDKTRLAELPGIIESYQSMVNDLARLKTDLADVAKIATQCEADANNAFCLENVQKVAKTLESKIATKKSELVAINSFLQSESDRLKSISLSVSNALKRIIAKLD